MPLTRQFCCDINILRKHQNIKKISVTHTNLLMSIFHCVKTRQFNHRCMRITIACENIKISKYFSSGNFIFFLFAIFFIIFLSKKVIMHKRIHIYAVNVIEYGCEMSSFVLKIKQNQRKILQRGWIQKISNGPLYMGISLIIIENQKYLLMFTETSVKGSRL